MKKTPTPPRPSPKRPPKAKKPTPPNIQLVGIRRGFFPAHMKDLHRLVATGLADNYMRLASGDVAVRIEVQEEDAALMPALDGVTQILLIYSEGQG